MSACLKNVCKKEEGIRLKKTKQEIFSLLGFSIGTSL